VGDPFADGGAIVMSLTLFVALLAGQPPGALVPSAATPPALHIHAEEPGAQLSVRADAPGWFGACAGLVTDQRPCKIAPAPTAPAVALHISGTRTFDYTVPLGTGPTSVRIEHRGHGEAAAGAVMLLGAILVIAAGVNNTRDGQLTSDGQLLVSTGASIEALGLILILHDLGSVHDRAVVLPSP